MKHLISPKERLAQFADSYFFLVVRLLILTATSVGIIIFAINRSLFEENVNLYIAFLVCILLHIASTIFSYFFDYGEEAKKANIVGAIFWSISFILLLANFILHVMQIV